ncbi:C40 family peptidase [Latilactobacillus curvatus]|uniref:C40 family peptidase n=1 Tax=Latilactobacillus curvatus TaxID=28038 RepID=UPI000FECD108|nr:NlpC/P60 family protein [Latilactobacillus curvatus]
MKSKNVLVAIATVLLTLGGIGVGITSVNSTTMVQAASMNSKQQAVVNLAQQQVGKPYVWGATGPNSFDCSGLVQYVYSHAAGINLPRVTNQQEACGSEVSLNALEPGDLLFWGNRGSTYHVAIYIGGGNFVQAPEPGQNVKVTNMKYYYPNFARRVLPTAPDVVSRGSLDKFTFENAQIDVSGWSAATDTTGKQYSYLFAMDADTGKELKRWNISRVDRPDVQHVYPNISGSLHSGFNLSTAVPDELKGHNVKIMVRYSSDLHGDYDTSDYYFDQVVSFPASDSRNSVDYLNQSGNNIHAIGWSIGMYTEDKPYRYAIVLDANTHQEYARVTIDSIDRPDVDKYYHNFPNATKSGFNVNIPVTDAMHGKNIFLDLRYTNDSRGNGDFVDSWATGNVMAIN